MRNPVKMEEGGGRPKLILMALFLTLISFFVDMGTCHRIIDFDRPRPVSRGIGDILSQLFYSGQLPSNHHHHPSVRTKTDRRVTNSEASGGGGGGTVINAGVTFTFKRRQTKNKAEIKQRRHHESTLSKSPATMDQQLPSEANGQSKPKSIVKLSLPFFTLAFETANNDSPQQQKSTAIVPIRSGAAGTSPASQKSLPQIQHTPSAYSSISQNFNQNVPPQQQNNYNQFQQQNGFNSFNHEPIKNNYQTNSLQTANSQQALINGNNNLATQQQNFLSNNNNAGLTQNLNGGTNANPSNFGMPSSSQTTFPYQPNHQINVNFQPQNSIGPPISQNNGNFNNKGGSELLIAVTLKPPPPPAEYSTTESIGADGFGFGGQSSGGSGNQKNFFGKLTSFFEGLMPNNRKNGGGGGGGGSHSYRDSYTDTYLNLPIDHGGLSGGRRRSL